MAEQLIIIGMGGHSKVVTDVANRMGYEVLGYLDDALPTEPCDKYLGRIEDAQIWLEKNVQFFLAIGNNSIRKKIVERLAFDPSRYAILLDPSAIIGLEVRIRPGAILMPGAIVNAASKIGAHAIINTAATVDHDCTVEDFVHLSPGVHLAGGVTIGQQTHVGIGTSVIPRVKVGRDSVIGAGAAVIRDIPDRTVAVGVPAKVIKQQEHAHWEVDFV